MTRSFQVQFPNTTDKALCISAPTTTKDTQSIIDFVHNQEKLKNTTSMKGLRKGKFNARKVVFIDLPPTDALVAAVRSLSKDGYEVHIRDHHNFEGTPTTRREQELRDSIKCLQRLLGQRSIISTRQKHPACASLIEPGEFSEAIAIITDADFDGWLGAMKAFGLAYSELDRDADILDGPWTNLLNGSPLSQLFVKAFSCTEAHEISQLFTTFASASQKDSRAISNLKSISAGWQNIIDNTSEMAEQAIEIAPGAWLVDTVDKGKFDLGHLSIILESRAYCRMTIIKRTNGPVAEFHGSQYTIALASKEKAKFNLHKILPTKFTASSPKDGIFSNTTFIMNLSPYMWEKILPALREYLHTSQLVDFVCKEKLSISA